VPRQRRALSTNVGSAEPALDFRTTNQLLMAVLAVLIDEREQRIATRDTGIKTEVLLTRLGLSSTLIGRLMGKQPAAIRVTLSRVRARAPK
jgi:hypothetical protein